MLKKRLFSPTNLSHVKLHLPISKLTYGPLGQWEETLLTTTQNDRVERLSNRLLLILLTCSAQWKKVLSLKSLEISGFRLALLVRGFIFPGWRSPRILMPLECYEDSIHPICFRTTGLDFSSFESPYINIYVRATEFWFGPRVWS